MDWHYMLLIYLIILLLIMLLIYLLALDWHAYITGITCIGLAFLYLILLLLSRLLTLLIYLLALYIYHDSMTLGDYGMVLLSH